MQLDSRLTAVKGATGEMRAGGLGVEKAALCAQSHAPRSDWTCVHSGSPPARTLARCNWGRSQAPTWYSC